MGEVRTVLEKDTIDSRSILRLCSHVKIDFLKFLKIKRSYSPHISLLRSFKEFEGVLKVVPVAGKVITALGKGAP